MDSVFSDVSPAPAGMIPGNLVFHFQTKGEPRTRGDDPLKAVAKAAGIS